MRRSSLSVTTLVALVALASGCGGDDPVVTSTTFSVVTAPDTSPVFTEDTSTAIDIDGTPGTDATGATTSTSNAGPTTTLAPGTPTSVAANAANTTVPSAGTPTTVVRPNTATTIGNTSGTTTDDFVVGVGTTDADGVVEATVEVRVRSGASGDVVVPVNRALTIVVPGPTEWDIDVDPDDRVIEVIDIIDVANGEAGDPFPEDGGAVIITLRPLTASSTTLRIISFEGPGDPITVKVVAV